MWTRLGLASHAIELFQEKVLKLGGKTIRLVAASFAPDSNHRCVSSDVLEKFYLQNGFSSVGWYRDISNESVGIMLKKLVS